MRVATRLEPVNQAVVVIVAVPMLSRLLTFRSDWSSGRKVAYRWVLDDLAPGAEVDIEVAGRSATLTADERGVAKFLWDGLDADGNAVGPSVATAAVGDGVRRMRLGRWSPLTVGLGGMMIDPYDHLDPLRRRVHTGRGRLKANIAVRSQGDGYMLTRSSGRYESSFDASGFLAEVRDRDADEVVWTFERDTDGLTLLRAQRHEISVERSDGVISVTKKALATDESWGLAIRTDEAGRAISIVDPSERGVEFEYDADGLLVGVVDASGFVYRYEHDDDGRLIGFTGPGSGKADLVRSNTDHGHRVTVVSAEGREAFYQVERLDDGTKVRTSRCCGGHPSVTTIDSHFIEVTKGDGTRIVTQKGGSAQRQVILPSGTTHTRMSETGRIVVNEATYLTESSPSGSVTTSPMGRVFALEETPEGTRIMRPGGSTELKKDSSGRVVRVEKSGVSMEVSYGENGLVSGLSWNDGRTAAFEHDRSGWLTAQHLAGGRSIHLERDGGGLIRQVDPPGSDSTSFEFLAPGKATSVRFPTDDGSEDHIDYFYDADGLLVGRQMSGSQRVRFVRDIGGQVCEIQDGDSHVEIENDRGRPVRVTSGPDGSISFTYDGPLITEIAYHGTVAGTVQYTYDEGFRPTSLKVGPLEAITGYNADGQVVSVGPARLIRDDSGRVLRIEAGEVSQIYQYGVDGLVSRMELAAGDKSLWTVDYTYDSVGRIVGMADSQSTEPVTYEYDGGERLVRVVGGDEFEGSYDGNGNPATVTRNGSTEKANCDPGDRMRSLGVSEIAYQPGGAVVSVHNGESAVRYLRDGLGRLRSIEAEATTRLERDGYGTIIAINSESTTVGLLNGRHGRPVAVVEADGTPLALLAGGTRRETPLLAIGWDRTLFIATDHVGSVRAVVDIATGELVEEERFDVWGRSTLHNGSSVVPFGFGGALRDRSNGLVHFPARTYSPDLMRWLSRDPEFFQGGSSNLYAYAANDPVNRRDPTGRKVEICRRATDVVPFDGAEHWWIRTANKEAGMTPDPVVTGGIFPNTVVSDHTGAGDMDDSTCDPVDNVDEECVESFMQTNKYSEKAGWYGDDLGMYGPVNTCQHWVDEVLSHCSSDFGVNGDYSVETSDPDAYDHWYNPDVPTHAPPPETTTPPLDYTPDPGQSTLDGGSLWE